MLRRFRRAAQRFPVGHRDRPRNVLSFRHGADYGGPEAHAGPGTHFDIISQGGPGADPGVVAHRDVAVHHCAMANEGSPPNVGMVRDKCLIPNPNLGADASGRMEHPPRHHRVRHYDCSLADVHCPGVGHFQKLTVQPCSLESARPNYRPGLDHRACPNH